MPMVNLLPWRQQRRRRQQRIFCGGLAASFAVAALLASLYGLHLDRQINRQEVRNRALAEDVADLDRRIAAVDAVQRHRDALDRRADALMQLWRERSTTVDIFNELARTMVAGVHYTALQRRDDRIAAQGVAASNVRVSELMRNLYASGVLATPALQGIAATLDEDYGSNATSFELSVDVVPATEEM